MDDRSPSDAARDTDVQSFVVRFTFDRAPDGGRWHGTIRHVQSNSERHFARLEEALSFITERVAIDEGLAPDGR